MASFKEAKEAFVSGGHGSSGSDILALLAGLLLSALLHRSLENLAYRTGRSRHSSIQRIAGEFAVLVVPLLAITTVLGERLWTSNLLLALSVLATSCLGGSSEDSLIGSLERAIRTRAATHLPDPPGAIQLQQRDDPSDQASSNPLLAGARPGGTLRRRITEPHQVLVDGFPPPSSPPETSHAPRRFHQPFLTVYRAQLILLTALSILAVDFTIFPRKFAKTESWGISLMDAGVGSFVFSLGIISALPILKRTSRISPQPLWTDLWRSTRKTIPLLVLGLVRVLFVKGVDYPEHVTEYGVHWNFFFTLSILPMAGVLVRRLYEGFRFNLALIGVLLAVVHQCVLGLAGVQEYVLSSAPRTTLISANREGLASLLGYVVIYVLGLSAGIYVLPPSPDFLDRLLRRQTPPSKLADRQPGKALVVYSSWMIIWWTLFFLFRAIVSPPSRRLANPTYCFWIAANNLSLITGHCFIHEVLVPGPSTPSGPSPSLKAPCDVPLTFEVINRNSLAIFLFANLLTGLINLSVHSIYLAPLPAFAILLSYAALIVIFAWSIRTFKISL